MKAELKARVDLNFASAAYRRPLTHARVPYAAPVILSRTHGVQDVSKL